MIIVRFIGLVIEESDYLSQTKIKLRYIKIV